MVFLLSVLQLLHNHFYFNSIAQNKVGSTKFKSAWINIYIDIVIKDHVTTYRTSAWSPQLSRSLLSSRRSTASSTPWLSSWSDSTQSKIYLSVEIKQEVSVLPILILLCLVISLIAGMCQVLGQWPLSVTTIDSLNVLMFSFKRQVLLLYYYQSEGWGSNYCLHSMFWLGAHDTLYTHYSNCQKKEKMCSRERRGCYWWWQWW